MTSLFGVSLTLIMWVLVAILAIGLLFIAYVWLRNPIMFKIGVRNIPRRRAQSTLIVVGLMLSTVIISAAFATGDTVDRSITGEVYSIYGSLDHLIQPRAVGNEAFDGEFEDGVARTDSFAATGVEGLMARIRQLETVDYVLPLYSDVAVAVNPERRLSTPLFTIVGLDPRAASGLPDVEALDGRRLEVSDLGPGEMYVNRSAAEELDVGAGDRIQVFALGRTFEFRVREVIQDRRLAGAGGVSIRREGGLLPLSVAQELFQAPGQLTGIAVSNQGGFREGVTHAEVNQIEIAAILASAPADAPRLNVANTKRVAVDFAELNANIFATFFLVLGLFSIGAGVLLIFMIFVMLAAERKSEMGMARALGIKRADLVQSFASEGMAYNLVAALVGTGLGVLVAFGMARIMARIFANIDIAIQPHVTPRSLVIAYSLGVVLTFLTVTFSSWRVSYINIVRAIRDIPEPPVPKPSWRLRGFRRTLVGLLFKPGSWKAWVGRVGLLILGVTLMSSTGASDSIGIQILVGLGGTIVFLAFIFLSFQMGPLFIVGSIPLIVVGSSTGSAFPLLFGLSLLPLGLALSVRSFGANERLTYTSAGLLILYVWLFDTEYYFGFQPNLVERIFGEVEGDIELFFLSGVMITVAATFVIVYNSDILLGVLSRLGRGLGALLPSIKMAIAYPLSSRTRTGMTMAMFCLVVFALIVMSSMNYNFNQIFLSDRALGGWDVAVDENPNNRIDDLRTALVREGSPAVDEIAAVGVTSIATRQRARVCQVEPTRPCSDIERYDGYGVRGQDAGFLAGSRIPLQARANGFGSDEAVWQAVATDPRYAVIDSFALGGGFGGPGVIRGIDPGATTFEPVRLSLLDRTTGRMQDVLVIGIIQLGASATFSGLHISMPAFENVFGEADSRRFFVQTTPGADHREVAREIESALLNTGAQAESIRHVLERQNATSNGFFYLMQGFMGLGLFVGVAAVGVIAFRTVVERRQQIGMLRALGYTRGMIATTFILESAFIAVMGILSGVVFALILSRQLITQEFVAQGVTSFEVPWGQIGIIIGLAFGFALLMTLIPSRQASSIPIAQALRYE
jgi:putative ABC transport system permease protein